MPPADWYLVLAPVLLGPVAARPGDVLALTPQCPFCPLVVFRAAGDDWLTVGKARFTDLSPYLRDGLIAPRPRPQAA